MDQQTEQAERLITTAQAIQDLVNRHAGTLPEADRSALATQLIAQAIATARPTPAPTPAPTQGAHHPVTQLRLEAARALKARQGAGAPESTGFLPQNRSATIAQVAALLSGKGGR